MGNYECKKCGSNRYVKAGKVGGEQRYKCKDCGCQFVPTRHKGRSANTKIVALFLYVSGLSLRRIAKAVKTDVHAVYRWILEYGRANYEKPEPQGEAVIVELDEMWHYLRSKKQKFGYGKLIAAIPVNLSTGNAEGATMLHFQGFTNDFSDGT
jgi:transposase